MVASQLKATSRRVASWFKTKIWEPFVSYCRQGAEPPKLARSFSVGFCLGICPLLGVSFSFCLLAIFVSFGTLHAPMTILANGVAVPFELLLIVPFMRFGEVMLHSPPMDTKPAALFDILFHNPGEALKSVGHALLGWIVVVIPASLVLALALLPVFSWLKRRLSRDDAGLYDRQEDWDASDEVEFSTELEADMEAASQADLLNSSRRRTPDKPEGG